MARLKPPGTCLVSGAFWLLPEQLGSATTTARKNSLREKTRRRLMVNPYKYSGTDCTEHGLLSILLQLRGFGVATTSPSLSLRDQAWEIFRSPILPTSLGGAKSVL